jgi:outer membrane protein assembly factor BamB
MAVRRWAGFLIFLVLGLPLFAGEWPSWRGPRGDGSSEETGIPLRWSQTENITWKVPIPGKGHSSPVIWGDRIFVTTCLEDKQQRLLLCLDRRTGKQLWQQVVVTAKLEPKHELNSYASSTPATDGQHVWVDFLDEPNIVVACYDFDGKEVWRKSPGQFYSKHGFSSSPVLYKDSLILNCDQDAVACIVALDKKTGEEKWRTDRPNRTRSYCVPLLVDAAGKKQLVLSGSKCVASYDPDTGKQYWIIDGPTEQFVASLVYTEDTLFLTGGYPTYHLLGIRPDGSGDVTNTHVLWHETKGASYVPSPIAHGKYFFVVSDGGVASCFEAKTGKRNWMERLGKHHSASPVSSDGYLYFPDDDGVTWVLKASDHFEVVSKNSLGEECYASPAISHGQIFIRALHNLYCIGPANK